MATKKGFTETLQAEKEAAAAAFMSQTGTDQPEGQDTAKKKKERKSERLNLTITPSNKEDLVIMSHIERRSINQIIDSLVDEYLEANQEKISAYRELFQD